MANYGFVSPGAAATDAITQFFLQRDAQARQAMLDQIAAKAREEEAARAQAEMGLRQQQLALQDRAQAGAEQDRAALREAQRQEQEFRRATTLAENALPDDPADPATRELLIRQGYGGQLSRKPGIVAQGPQIDTVGDNVPLYDVTTSPDTYTMRGGSKYLSARAAEEARAAQARQTADQRAQEGEADRQLRLLIAQMSAGGRAESNDLRNRLLEIQAQLAQDKLEAGRTERAKGQASVAADRQRVRTLAQGLLDDPALDDITGAIEGRRDTFLQGANVDALARFNQLVKALALGERSKMKGQGTITDYEAKMLESAVSAINRAAGPDAVKKHLQEIVTLLGDTPNAGQESGEAPATNGFRVVREEP